MYTLILLYVEWWGKSINNPILVYRCISTIWFIPYTYTETLWQSKCIYWKKALFPFVSHKAVFWLFIPKGIACSSVLMQRNSPQTHIILNDTIFKHHQLKDVGKVPLYTQQHIKWIKWAVHAKSIHCFVLCTSHHNANAPTSAFSRKIIITDRPPKSRTCISLYWKA